MVDELGKTIITVPMCLRDPTTSGFPPSDNGLRNWLLGLGTDQQEVAKGLHCFLSSLLDVTLQELKVIDNDLKESKQIPSVPEGESVKQRQSLLASRFRNKMTEGQKLEVANQYRQSFFDKVIKQANQLSSTTSNAEYSISEAGIRLKEFIDEHGDIRSEVESTKWPLVVLAFDEAHNLTGFPTDGRWTVYSELRRSLCWLVQLPIFTLFLSTAGKFRLFSPDRLNDYSGRVKLGYQRVLPPITETGFDQFALTAIENQTTLDQVVQDEWICSFGRPLCVFLVCALFRRTHVVLRVGSPPVITPICQALSFELRSWTLLLTSCWVVTRSSMRVLLTHWQPPMTGPLRVYLCDSPWNSISQTQMRDPFCASRSSVICGFAL